MVERVWKCGECGKTYLTEDEAVGCENRSSRELPPVGLVFRRSEKSGLYTYSIIRSYFQGHDVCVDCISEELGEVELDWGFGLREVDTNDESFWKVVQSLSWRHIRPIVTVWCAGVPRGYVRYVSITDVFRKIQDRKMYSNACELSGP